MDLAHPRRSHSPVFVNTLMLTMVVKIMIFNGRLSSSGLLDCQNPESGLFYEDEFLQNNFVLTGEIKFIQIA